MFLAVGRRAKRDNTLKRDNFLLPVGSALLTQRHSLRQASAMSAKKPDKKPKVSPSEWNFVDDSQTGGPAPRKAAGVGFQMGCTSLVVVALITAVYIIDLEEMSVVGKDVMQRYHEVSQAPILPASAGPDLSEGTCLSSDVRCLTDTHWSRLDQRTRTDACIRSAVPPVHRVSTRQRSATSAEAERGRATYEGTGEAVLAVHGRDPRAVQCGGAAIHGAPTSHAGGHHRRRRPHHRGCVRRRDGRP